MLPTIATLTAHSARRIAELGALIGLIGGLALAARELPSFRKYGLIVAGLLLAVGFALIIYALHFGKTF
jgi:mannose/fructose/N-acetylgalactosamine-specific phosphotransferase system component IIC